MAIPYALKCALIMQKTSSVLHNLLAVVEEVQLARIEIRNLIHAKFNSPSGNLLPSFASVFQQYLFICQMHIFLK